MARTGKGHRQRPQGSAGSQGAWSMLLRAGVTLQQETTLDGTEKKNEALN